MVNNAELELERNKLEKSIAFKILFYLDKNIKNLLEFSNNLNVEVNAQLYNDYNSLINDYIYNKKPLAYIIHSSNFFGRDFIVNDNVHSPRIETETIVEETINLIKEINNIKLLDLCCGTGVIGITIKLLLTNIDLTLLDNDINAINNTRENLDKFNIESTIINSNLFDNVKSKFNCIVCNPPYIDNNYPLDKSVYLYEPHNSLFAEDNGLFFYEKILSECKDYLEEKYLMIFEIGYNQANEVVKIIKKYIDCEPTVVKDYYNNNRAIIINKL